MRVITSYVRGLVGIQDSLLSKRLNKGFAKAFAKDFERKKCDKPMIGTSLHLFLCIYRDGITSTIRTYEIECRRSINLACYFVVIPGRHVPFALSWILFCTIEG